MSSLNNQTKEHTQSQDNHHQQDIHLQGPQQLQQQSLRKGNRTDTDIVNVYDAIINHSKERDKPALSNSSIEEIKKRPYRLVKTKTNFRENIKRKKNPKPCK